MITPEFLEEIIKKSFLPLSNNDSVSAQGRLRGQANKPRGLQIDVCSDDMSLKDKQAVSDAFDQLWPKEHGHAWLNFKRSKPRMATPAQAPLARAAAKAKRQIPGARHVILISSGKGGVGKSTLSCQLALKLANLGHKVGLLDADLWGPSVPLLMGVSGPLQVLEDQKLEPKWAQGVQVMSFGFMSGKAHPFMSRGPLVSKALDQLATKTAWDCDYLIVDLPPGTGDVQISLAEDYQVDGAIVVTTPEPLALLDAHKGLSMFQKYDVTIYGIVENMAYFACGQCQSREAIFGEGTAEFISERGVPLLARLPFSKPLQMATQAPGALVTDSLIDEALNELAMRIINDW